ncbi:hypothetical protein RDI58_027050 [Solanum bulbocastanum]|uniref:Uncharacterized protein n=1 Tax=Solanum bulbocastanum TaxID=147425 RepID=A0AAN8Y1Q4_SOLBU
MSQDNPYDLKSHKYYNYVIPSMQFSQSLNSNDRLVDPRLYSQEALIVCQRLTSSSMSGTVESFSGPRPPHQQTAVLPSRKHPRSPPVEPEDCRSDCGLSSFSVVEDGDCEGDNDNIVSSS